jgi:hypothetical protein
MKKGFIGIILVVVFAVFAYGQQTPRFTTQRGQDGVLGIICETEQDALLLISGNYNLPPHYRLLVPLEDIYFEEFHIGDKLMCWVLRGTRLTEDGTPGRLGSFSQSLYNINRNTKYFVMWDVVIPSWMQELARMTGTRANPVSVVMGIADSNGTVLRPVRTVSLGQ